MKKTAHTLRSINEQVGTITDLSRLCEVRNDELMFAPGLTGTDLQAISAATQQHLCCRNEVFEINFHRDGKRILSFATAYQKRRADLWTDYLQDQEEWLQWALKKMVLRWFVEHGPEMAKQKCVDWLNLDLQESDWQLFRENGCGFLKNEMAMQETTAEEKRALAQAYREVRDNMTEHLTRLWLELFEQHGVAGAKQLMRERWHPADEETRDNINAAYLAAKKIF